MIEILPEMEDIFAKEKVVLLLVADQSLGCRKKILMLVKVKSNVILAKKLRI